MPALPKPSGDFEQAPEGTQLAVCVGVVDLGTQPNMYQGQVNGEAHKVLVFWETTAEVTSRGDRFQVMREYTWSMGDKSNLRKDLQSWRGKAFTEADFDGPTAFDIKNIIGKPCQVVIGRTSGDKAKVTAVAGWPKGIPAPTPSVTSFFVWLSKEDYAEEHFDALPDFWKDKIKASPEWKALHAPTPRANGGMSQVAIDKAERGDDSDMSDEIPF